MKKTHMFNTVTDSMTDLVNMKYEGNRRQVIELPMFCLLHSINCFAVTM